MSGKIGIELCSFHPVHHGGKDQVAYNLLEGFRSINVDENMVCFAHKDLVPIIRKYNSQIKIVIVPKIRFPDRLNELRLLFIGVYIKYIAKKMDLDVILFTRKYSPAIKFSMTTVLIPHDVSVFFLGTIPGMNYSAKEAEKEKRRIKKDFEYRDYMIAISDFDKSEMYKYLPWASSKIKRIYNPIRFQENLIKINPDGFLTVLNVQWPHKNVITVLKAYAEIVGKIRNKLIIVGKFPENIFELKKFVMEHGLEDNILFTGFVSDDELNDIIEKTRIYINASYFEGFGMTAVEMMGRGIPTIVANNTAMPEVTMGLCKYYGPTGDSHALAQTILDELRNPQTAEQLCMISEAVRERYNIKGIASEYWTFLNQCSYVQNNSHTERG